jgi:hypothetical protein
MALKKPPHLLGAGLWNVELQDVSRIGIDHQLLPRSRSSEMYFVESPFTGLFMRAA